MCTPTKLNGDWMDRSCRPDLVSVIVPTYNRAHFIVSTLDSVFHQTYRPIELIIVDDGSSDQTAEVVKRWIVDRDPVESAFSVRYLGQDNAGAPVARNAGLHECSGEFIQFLDSDDILHHEKLTKQVSTLKRESVDFCVCNYQGFKDSLSAPGSIFDFYSRSHALEDFPDQYPMGTASPLFRRETIRANGPWDTCLKAGQDFEYNFRLMARGARGVWLNEVLLYMRKHDGPERIQSIPLAKRFRSMYTGLAKMEIEAIERGVCSPRLLNSFGMRAYQYYRHTRAEGSFPQARMFLRYARPRLFWTTKAVLLARRTLPAPVAKVCVTIKKILRGRK